MMREEEQAGLVAWRDGGAGRCESHPWRLHGHWGNCSLAVPGMKRPSGPGAVQRVMRDKRNRMTDRGQNKSGTPPSSSLLSSLLNRYMKHSCCFLHY